MGVAYSNLDVLLQQKSGCSACSAGEEGNRVVLPSGPHNANVLVLGRNPGKVDFGVGVPFVDQAGEVLNEWLTVLGIHRNECFLDTVIGCYVGKNRPPSSAEKQTCWGLWLENEIALIPFKLVIALGVEASKIFGDGKVGDLKHHDDLSGGIWVLYMPHPGTARRNKKLGVEITHLLLPAVRGRIRKILDI